MLTGSRAAHAADRAHADAAPASAPLGAAARASRRAAALALLCTALAALVLAAVDGRLRPGSAPAPAPGAPAQRALAGPGGGLLALPGGLRAPVSARLGAGTRAYRVRARAATLAAANPAQGLRLRFGRSTVGIDAGATRVGLRLSGVGYGRSLRAGGAPARRALANRVSYSRPGIREWYANGPLGLEQGFTLDRPPAARASGPLTLALSLSGGAHASLAGHGRGVAFRAPGGPELRYGELSASDARGRALRSWIELDRGRLLLRVRARGARYPLRIDPLVQQGPKLKGQGIAGVARFGTSVALSADGDTALVGSPGYDGGAGAAWVFTRAGSTWTQQGPKLLAGDEVGAGQFGASVALSADGATALIGGHSDDGYVGAAWVFARAGSSWTQQGPKLLAGDEVGPGDFGASVALSADGDTALIGGWNDAKEYGAAWVFTRSGSSWSQQGPKLVGSGVIGLPLIGRSVALSADGDTAVVGAPWDNDEGSVRVFTRQGSTWTQQGPKIQGEGEVGKGNFGESLALSSDGQTLLVGGPWDFFHAGSVPGAAWVFARAGSTWSQQGPKLTAGEERGSGFFGESVALSADGDTALVGGPTDTASSGAVWAFARSGSSWSESAELRGAGESDHAEFGGAVALSADARTALVGGRGDDAFSGSAWPFAAQPAGPPDPAQFGRCVKLKMAGAAPPGEYSTPRCTAPVASGKRLWRPGVARSAFTSVLARGRVKLEGVGGERVSCTSQWGAGEYSGSGLTTVGGFSLMFGGCESGGESCASASAAAGEVVTAPLAGELGIIAMGETRAQNTIGLRLFAAGEAGEVMEFTCGSVPVSVRGSVIVPLRANRMLARAPMHFRASKGRQRPEAFAGAPQATLEASFGLAPYEQAGLTMQARQFNEEAVEVNSTL